MKYGIMIAAVLAGSAVVGCDKKGTTTSSDSTSGQAGTSMQKAGDQMKAMGQNAADAAKNTADAAGTEAQKMKDKTMAATQAATTQP